MVLLGKCPKCEELVTTSAPLTSNRLQCPCCGAEFVSESFELIDVPQLIILDSDSTASNSTSSDTTAGGATDSPSEVVSASSGETSQVAEPVYSTAAAARARAQSRRKRSATGEILKVVFGGIAGLVIAQIILWWLPGDLRRDPFDIAPLLPEWLAFATPPEFRSESPVDPKSSESPPSNLLDQDESSEQTSTLQAPNADTSLQPSTDEVKTTNRLTPGLVDAPMYSGSELKDLLRTARNQLAAYHVGLDREQRRKQLNLLYQTFCEIGQVATFIDLTDPDIGRLMQATEATLVRISKSTDQLRLVGRAAQTWINYPSRVTNGIAIAGEVTEIKPVGRLFQSTVTLYGRPDESIRLMSLRNPSTDVRQNYKLGDQIVAFGSIVDQPEIEFVGYEGANVPVVWRGLYLVVRPPVPPPGSSPTASD